MRCQFDSHNHSKDFVTLYHGNVEPLILCGYHSTWNLNTILKGLSK